MNALRQKFFAQSGKCWCVRSAKHKRRDCQIQLIDKIELQQAAKKLRAAFAGDATHFVVAPQLLQHRNEIDRTRFG